LELTTKSSGCGSIERKISGNIGRTAIDT